MAAAREGASRESRSSRTWSAVVKIDPQMPSSATHAIAAQTRCASAPKARRTMPRPPIPSSAVRSIERSTSGPTMSEPAVIPTPKHTSTQGTPAAGMPVRSVIVGAM